MEIEPFESEQIREIKTWERLIRSEEWQVYLKLCEDHKAYLRDECLRRVGEADFHSAVRYEAKAEDLGKLIDLVKSRLSKLRTGGQDGG